MVYQSCMSWQSCHWHVWCVNIIYNQYQIQLLNQLCNFIILYKLLFVLIWYMVYYIIQIYLQYRHHVVVTLNILYSLIINHLVLFTTCPPSQNTRVPQLRSSEFPCPHIIGPVSSSHQTPVRKADRRQGGTHVCSWECNCNAVDCNEYDSGYSNSFV